MAMYGCTSLTAFGSPESQLKNVISIPSSNVYFPDELSPCIQTIQSEIFAEINQSINETIHLTINQIQIC